MALLRLDGGKRMLALGAPGHRNRNGSTVGAVRFYESGRRPPHAPGPAELLCTVSSEAHLGEFGAALGVVGGPAANGSPPLLAIGSPGDGEAGAQLRSGVVWLLAATAGFAEQLCVGGRNLTVAELTGGGGSGGGVVHAKIRGPR